MPWKLLVRHSDESSLDACKASCFKLRGVTTDSAKCSPSRVAISREPLDSSAKTASGWFFSRMSFYCREFIKTIAKRLQIERRIAVFLRQRANRHADSAIAFARRGILAKRAKRRAFCRKPPDKRRARRAQRATIPGRPAAHGPQNMGERRKTHHNSDTIAKSEPRRENPRGAKPLYSGHMDKPVHSCDGKMEN